MDYGGVAVITTADIDHYDRNNQRDSKSRLSKQVSIVYTPGSEAKDKDEFAGTQIIHNDYSKNMMIDTGFGYVMDEDEKDNKENMLMTPQSHNVRQHATGINKSIIIQTLN